MKIIFLDIDGVLNVCFPARDEFGRLFHPELILNLKRIVDATGAKIVITSTWRSAGLPEMQRMWKLRHLPGEVIGITPYCAQIEEEDIEDISLKAERGFEIEEWKIGHSIEAYVILDDDNDMLESQQNNFVKCSGNITHPDCIDIGYGLTSICADIAIEILNKTI